MARQWTLQAGDKWPGSQAGGSSGGRQLAGPLARERPLLALSHQPGSATSPGHSRVPRKRSGLSPNTDPETHSFGASHLSCSEEVTASASGPAQRQARQEHSGSRGPNRAEKAAPVLEVARRPQNATTDSRCTPCGEQSGGHGPGTRQATKTWILLQEGETWRAQEPPMGTPTQARSPGDAPRGPGGDF